jgi:hypothetical protein
MDTSPAVNAVKKYLLIVVVSIICLVILSVSVFGAYLWLPANVHYHLTQRYQISPNTDRGTVYLGIILPKSGPYQTVKNLSLDWDGEQSRDSLAEVDTLKLWKTIDGEQVLEATLEYDLILPQGKGSWQAPIEKYQLLPQDNIESDQPEIEQAALGLKDGSDQAYAYRIYRFTSDYLGPMEGDCQDSNVSALGAYRSHIAACVGYSRLMVALCRAAGIPAKMVIGIALPDILFPPQRLYTSGIPGEGHAWVEYSSSGGWQMADPSWAQGYSTLLEFNRNDGRHLSYGEFDRFIEGRQDLLEWVSERAFPLDQKLTYLFAASNDSASISSSTKITKSWDGRWLNAILVLVGVTIILGRIINWIFRDRGPARTPSA